MVPPVCSKFVSMMVFLLIINPQGLIAITNPNLDVLDNENLLNCSVLIIFCDLICNLYPLSTTDHFNHYSNIRSKMLNLWIYLVAVTPIF